MPMRSYRLQRDAPLSGDRIGVRSRLRRRSLRLSARRASQLRLFTVRYAIWPAESAVLESALIEWP